MQLPFIVKHKCSRREDAPGTGLNISGRYYGRVFDRPENGRGYAWGNGSAAHRHFYHRCRSRRKGGQGVPRRHHHRRRIHRHQSGARADARLDRRRRSGDRHQHRHQARHRRRRLAVGRGHCLRLFGRPLGHTHRHRRQHRALAYAHDPHAQCRRLEFLALRLCRFAGDRRYGQPGLRACDRGAGCGTCTVVRRLVGARCPAVLRHSRRVGAASGFGPDPADRHRAELDHGPYPRHQPDQHQHRDHREALRRVRRTRRARADHRPRAWPDRLLQRRRFRHGAVQGAGHRHDACRGDAVAAAHGQGADGGPAAGLGRCPGIRPQAHRRPRTAGRSRLRRS